MKKSNYIVLDFETGGFEPSVHAITEYAAVVVEPINLEIIDRLQFYVAPYEAEYTKKAEEVSGINQVKLKREGVKYENGMRAIQKQFESYKTGGKGDKGYPTIVGHNAAFDIRFLKFNFEVMGWDLNKCIKEYHFDTMQTARIIYQSEKDMSFSLGSVCSKLGIDLEKAHGAMDDVLATYKVFQRIVEILRAKGGSDTGVTKRFPNYQF